MITWMYSCACSLLFCVCQWSVKGLYQAFILWGNMAHLVSGRNVSRLLLLRGALTEAHLCARSFRVTFPSLTITPFNTRTECRRIYRCQKSFHKECRLTCYSSVQWPFTAEEDIYRALIDRVVSNTLVGEWFVFRLVRATSSVLPQ